MNSEPDKRYLRFELIRQVASQRTPNTSIDDIIADARKIEEYIFEEKSENS